MTHQKFPDNPCIVCMSYPHLTGYLSLLLLQITWYYSTVNLIHLLSFILAKFIYLLHSFVTTLGNWVLSLISVAIILSVYLIFIIIHSMLLSVDHNLSSFFLVTTNVWAPYVSMARADTRVKNNSKFGDPNPDLILKYTYAQCFFHVRDVHLFTSLVDQLILVNCSKWTVSSIHPKTLWPATIGTFYIINDN